MPTNCSMKGQRQSLQNLIEVVLVLVKATLSRAVLWCCWDLKMIWYPKAPPELNDDMVPEGNGRSLWMIRHPKAAVLCFFHSPPIRPLLLPLHVAASSFSFSFSFCLEFY